MSQSVLTLSALRVELDPSGTEIEDEVSFEIDKGEVVGLVGESASGKTTAATALLGHQRRGARIASGRVTVNGLDILSLRGEALREIRGKVVSYVPQDPSTSLNPARRIGKQLMEALDAHGYGASRRERHERLKEMLDEVLLPTDSGFLRRYPHQLSGGQQQRVALAMAFACRPAVIVLDEPTTGLDVTTQAHVLRTIKDLTRNYGVAALYVTHDLAVVANLADRIAVMYAGRLVEVGPKDELLRAACHPYTRRLLEAIPDPEGAHKLRGIAGRSPVPGHRPQGCFFAPRCSDAVEKCNLKFPPEEGPSQKHRVRCWRWTEVLHRGFDRSLLASTPGETDHPAANPVLEVKDLRASHGDQEILHGISIAIYPDRCVALVGESGSGKTTLARCMAGIHPGRISGEIRYQGRVLGAGSRSRTRSTRQAIQYIFQSPYGSLNPRKSVAQILAQPLHTFFDLDRGALESKMQEALEMVSLDAGLLGRYPDQLSGGERQRVAIARALIAEPSVLICDEITSSLDVSVQAAIVELLARLTLETHVGMVFVTHHLPLVSHIANDVAVMSEGRIVESGRVDRVLSDPQTDYTRRLLLDTPTIPVAGE